MTSTLRRFVRAFFRRVRDGEIKNALYLSYYYTYLFFFDRRHGTNFTNSHAPSEMEGSLRSGTGNFPAHPRLIQRYLRESGLSKDARILDVGHGSGIVLFVASQYGFTRLTGIEHAAEPYRISVENLGDRAELMHGDAFALDLTTYDAIFFFSPFRGEMASRFFSDLPGNIHTLVTVNHDRIIEPVVEQLGFRKVYDYQHPLYANFNGVVWKR